MKYEVIDHKLIADGTDTGVYVQVDGDKTIFRKDGKGLASYSSVHWESAVIKFIQLVLKDNSWQLIIYRSK